MTINMIEKNISFLKEIVQVPEKIISQVTRYSINQQVEDEEKLQEFYDICIEYLQKEGFDKNYQLTDEGRRIETIIDYINDNL